MFCWSGGYNASQLQLEWEPNSPVTFDEGLQLPEYSLKDVILNSSITCYDQHASSNFAQHVDNFYGKSGNELKT